MRFLFISAPETSKPREQRPYSSATFPPKMKREIQNAQTNRESDKGQSQQGTLVPPGLLCSQMRRGTCLIKLPVASNCSAYEDAHSSEERLFCTSVCIIYE